MTRYFVIGHCSCPEPVEHEVSKTDYVNAERVAGFHNTMGQPNEPATLAKIKAHLPVTPIPGVGHEIPPFDLTIVRD